MRIYKILTEDQYAALERLGEIPGAPVDIADGFVHLSTGAQVRETAAKHFARQSGLVILALDADALGDALEWEPSRGGALFPHLYGALRQADIVDAGPLPLGADGMHLFPDWVR